MVLRLALALSFAWVTVACAGQAPAPPAPATRPAAVQAVEPVDAPVAADVPRAPRAPRAPRPAPVGHIPMAIAQPGEEVHSDTLFAVRPPARFELDNFGGQIIVVGWDRNAVHVQATHARSARVDVEVTPAVVSVQATRVVRARTGARELRNLELPAQVDYQISLPRWMGLRLSGVQTEMVVEGMQSDVSAEAVSGPISVRGGRGSVRVSAINGGVEVSGVRGTIEASSMSEGVTIHDVEGRIRVESVNGDVDLDRIVSDAVEASTVSGDLRYSGELRPGGSYRFASHSGNVIVALPQSPNVAASINTWSGDFQSSIPLRVNVVRPRREFDFTLGDGRAELDLESFSGAIRLVRAAEMQQRQAESVLRDRMRAEQRRMREIKIRIEKDKDEGDR
jgi:hypothetical protein